MLKSESCPANLGVEGEVVFDLLLNIDILGDVGDVADLLGDVSGEEVGVVRGIGIGGRNKGCISTDSTGRDPYDPTERPVGSIQPSLPTLGAACVGWWSVNGLLLHGHWLVPVSDVLEVGVPNGPVRG